MSSGPSGKHKTKKIGFWFNDDDARLLRAAAQAEGMTYTDFVKRLVHDHAKRKGVIDAEKKQAPARR